jgi:hypothetical protein
MKRTFPVLNPLSWSACLAGKLAEPVPIPKGTKELHARSNTI